MENKLYLKAILLSLLILIFPIIGGVFAGIRGLSGSDISLAYGISFLLGGLVGLILAKVLFDDLTRVGLKAPSSSNYTYLILIILLLNFYPYLRGLVLS